MGKIGKSKFNGRWLQSRLPGRNQVKWGTPRKEALIGWWVVVGGRTDGEQWIKIRLSLWVRGYLDRGEMWGYRRQPKDKVVLIQPLAVRLFRGIDGSLGATEQRARVKADKSTLWSEDRWSTSTRVPVCARWRMVIQRGQCGCEPIKGPMQRKWCWDVHLRRRSGSQNQPER